MISDNEDVDEVDYFSTTCLKCGFRGNKDADFHWEKSVARGGVWVETDRLPNRCNPCDAQRSRFKRMRRSLEKLFGVARQVYGEWPLTEKQLAANAVTQSIIDEADPGTQKSYRKLIEPRPKSYPKMVTIGLPSVPDDPRSQLEQLLECKRKWNAFRRYYQNLGLFHGGIYATECTVKVNFDRDNGPWFGIKYHVHIHSAIVMPYLNRHRLLAFSASGLKFGLGRASITGRPKDLQEGEYYSPAQHLAHYLSKYITKAGIGVRSANFGKLIGYRPTSCLHGKDSTSR